jgi:hypothetical protein
VPYLTSRCRLIAEHTICDIPRKQRWVPRAHSDVGASLRATVMDIPEAQEWPGELAENSAHIMPSQRYALDVCRFGVSAGLPSLTFEGGNRTGLTYSHHIISVYRLSDYIGAHVYGEYGRRKFGPDHWLPSALRNSTQGWAQ